RPRPSKHLPQYGSRNTLRALDNVIRSSLRHAFQFAHVRCFLCGCCHFLLEHSFVAGPKKFSCCSQLYFLLRLETSVRRTFVRDHRDGFFAWPSMAKAREHTRRRWLVASVCMNLSMLGFFKYGNFLLENFQWLLARIGIVYQPPHLDILLPVG